MYASCRGSEWAQPDQANAHLDTYHRNDFGNAYACTLTDIKLLTLKNHPMTMSAALQTPHLVGRVQIRFEQQKNGTNHEWRLFVRNAENKRLYFVAAFLRILKRFHILVGVCNDLPLIIYRTSDGAIQNIGFTNIEQAMRSAASDVYGLHPIRDKAALHKRSSQVLLYILHGIQSFSYYVFCM